MPEETQPFEVAVVFNGHPGQRPCVLMFKGRTGDEAMAKATQHLEKKTTFRLQDQFTWIGPDGEAVITPSIVRIEC